VAHRRRWRPVIWLFAGLAVVLAGFVAETTLMLSSDRRLAGEAAALRSNALPSASEMVAARSALTRMALCTGRLDALPRVFDCVARARSDVDRAFVSYSSRLPNYAGEKQIVDDARGQLTALDQQLEGSRRLPAVARVPADLLDAIQRSDEALGRLAVFNSRHARAHAARIAELRRSSAWMEIALGSAALAIAAAATLLAVRATQRHTRFLEERARELEGFAGTMAHDVLSPLTAVGAAVPMMQTLHPEDPDTQRLASRALSAVRRVRMLVDHLLAFARAGAEATSGRSDAQEAVVAAARELEEEAAAAGVALSVELDDPGKVDCAPGILASILFNLAGNAIKYMGGARDRRVILRACHDDQWVRFEVEDTGPGVPPEFQETIFRPFVRLDARRAGLGLGLATVQRLVHGHRGRVGVHSRPGHGALFWFELPVAHDFITVAAHA
jgi:signal transduction histidine kinase